MKTIKAIWNIMMFIIVGMIIVIIVSPIAITAAIWWIIFRNSNTKEKFSEIMLSLIDLFLGDTEELNAPFINEN